VTTRSNTPKKRVTPPEGGDRPKTWRTQTGVTLVTEHTNELQSYVTLEKWGAPVASRGGKTNCIHPRKQHQIIVPPVIRINKKCELAVRGDAVPSFQGEPTQTVQMRLSEAGSKVDKRDVDKKTPGEKGRGVTEGGDVKLTSGVLPPRDDPHKE